MRHHTTRSHLLKNVQESGISWGIIVERCAVQQRWSARPSIVSRMAGMMCLMLLAMLLCTSQAHEYIHPKSQLLIENLVVKMDPEVTISTDTAAFSEQRQKYVVKWQGVRDATEDDLIALYTPANGTVWKMLPVQFLSCASLDAGHKNTGSGQATFTVLNMRSTYRFALLRGGVIHPELVAQTGVISNRVRYQPTGGHLALHEDQRSVVIQWVSGSRMQQQAQWTYPTKPGHNMTSRNSQETATETGVTELSLGRYRFTATSSTVTYKMYQMCGYPANATAGWLNPGYIHSAIVPSATMIPGQRVYYRYGKEGSGAGWSKEYSFVAPMGPGVAALKQLNTEGEATEPDQAGPQGASSGSTSQTDQEALLLSGTKQQSRRLKAQGTSKVAAAGSKVAAAGSKVAAAGSKVAAAQPQQAKVVSKGQSSSEGPAAFKFLMFNDVAMTNPLLFNNPGTGLSFAPDYGQNSSLLSSYMATGAESDAHLALMVGDLAYAMGYGADWDVFGAQFEDVFTQWPMAVGTGNHERDWPGTGDAFGNTARDSGGECNVPFTYRWYTPANPTDRPKELNPFVSYYSFSQGPVHFLVLDSETPSGPQTTQGRFVASDLAAVDRSVTPWVVVALHRMMVAPATWRRKWTGDVDVMERLQKDYEELFHKYQVDVVVSGHEHAYARTCPIYRYKCAPNAPLDTPTPTPTPTPTSKARAPTTGQTGTVAAGSWQDLGAAARRLEAGLQGMTSGSSWWLRLGRAAAGADGGATTDSSGAAAGGAGAGRTGERGAAAGGQEGGEARAVGDKAVHHRFRARAGGPVYVLAGHAGAGFTHGFPDALPPWVEAARQDINGFLRFTATATQLKMEAVVSLDGSVMDDLTLVIGE